MRQLQTLLNEKNFQTIDEANVFLSGLRGSSFETVDENAGSNGRHETWCKLPAQHFVNR
jgi:hypothetical protein